jgi:PAS domain S-box-containing protein
MPNTMPKAKRPAKASLKARPAAGSARGDHQPEFPRRSRKSLSVPTQFQGNAEMHRLLFERNPDGVFSLDTAGRFTVVNPACERISGYSRAELLGKAFFELCAPDQLAKTVEEFERCLRNPAYAQIETALIRKDGRRVELWVAGEPSVAEGRVVALHYTAKDISARKQAQQERQRFALAVQQERDRLAALVERAPFGIYVVDSQFCIAMMNAGSQDGAFRNVRPVIGRNLSEAMRILWPEPVAAEIIGHFRRTLDTGESYYSRDFVQPRHDVGSVEGYEWELHRMTLPDGQYGVICYYFDSTKLRQTEAALRQSELFYRQTLESIPGMVFTTRADGYCDYQSQQWMDYTGIPMSEHLGNGWNRLLHPEDRQRAFAAWRAAVEGRAPYDLEYRVRRHDGAYEWFKVVGRPIRDASGQIVRWFGVALNVEALKRGEEALKRTTDRFVLLAETAAALLASANPQVIVEDLCGKVLRHLDCEAFFNFLVDEKAGRLRLNACAGVPPEEVANIQWLDYGVAVCGCVARDRTRIIVEDIPNAGDPRTALVQSYGVQAYCCHPLMAGDQLIGTLSFGCKRRAHFTSDEIDLMRAVCDLVAVAMERIRSEAARQRNEARWNAAIESLAEGAIIATKDEQVIYWNPAARAMHGFTRSDEGLQSLEKTPLTFQLWTADGSHMLELDEWPMRRIRRGEAVRNLELRVRRPDQGWEKIFSYSGAMVETTSGEQLIFLSCYDMTELRQAEKAVEASLREKEVMLKEIHHRVKNNLQVIASLVDLQTDTLAAPSLRGVFQEVRDRVRSMALVHEKLYQSQSLACVDFADYAFSLLDYLARSHSQPGCSIDLKTDLQPVSLSIEKAVPCGLILNELISNAYKHAFRGRTQGEVRTRLEMGPDGRICLRVTDNGVGLPAGVDWRHSRSLGLRLVQLLAGQLHANVQVRTANGTEFEIAFAPEKGETGL